MGRDLKQTALVYGVLGAICLVPVIGLFLRASGAVTRTPPAAASGEGAAVVPAAPEPGEPLVTVYGASWCPSCRKARAWLDERKLPYRDLDIEKDPAARKTMLALNPEGTIPTLQIGTEVLVGFDAEAMESSLTRAVARRRFQ